MLERMRTLMKRIPMMRFNLEKARARAEKCTAVLSDMPKGGMPESLQEKVEKIMECEHRLKLIKDELAADRKILEPLIAKLSSAKERTIAHLRYIDGDSVFTIAMEIGMSERQVFRIIRSAEKNLSEMLKKDQNVIDVSKSVVL